MTTNYKIHLLFGARSASAEALKKKGEQKTFDAFSRLPDEFVVEDVMRCFKLNNINSARTRVKRLLEDHLIEKSGEFVENGTTKGKYRKTGILML